jgi:hypothetical protein
MTKLFVDDVFPADVTSLCFQPEFKQDEFVAAVKSWRRPRQWNLSATLFVDDVCPGDIEQGQLGDCWLLSFVSILNLNL